MSIVERAADMFGPVAQPERNAAAGGGIDLKPDLIERAGSYSSQRSDFPVDQVVALEPEAKDNPAPATGRVSRTLNIDLNRLRAQSMVTPDADRSVIGESFRRIKRRILANVANSKADSGANLVMITSALQGEGKTFCTINLAISIAMEMDRTVLLVDADVARPSVQKSLGVDAKQGLMDVLLDRTIDLADVMWKTNIGKLTILPAGTPQRHATELLASEAMRSLLHEMAQRYPDRIIIFDSPPLLITSESAVLASRMGQILLVVEADATTETALKDALSRVETSNVVGLLLNKGQPLGAGWDGYDGYGYGYGS